MSSGSLNIEADDDFLPLRALNDFLFCDRRAALHFIENLWIENQFVFEGLKKHARAHDEGIAEDCHGGARVVRAMWLRSDQLRLIGKADVVEYRPTTPVGVAPRCPGDPRETPYPIEYKRGKRKRWDNDDVQLCAQGLCLEEMLGVSVPAGAVFHVSSRRRREVVFDEALRRMTTETAARLHELVAGGKTPPPVVKARCKGCSLVDVCLPRTLSRADRAACYVRKLYEFG